MKVIRNKYHLLIDRAELKVSIIYYEGNVTHKMILVLSSDGVREFSLVCYIIGVPVHIDWGVSVTQIGWGLVLGVIFIEVGCGGQVIQLVGHQTQAPPHW